mmetsp:Transcript_53834/g.64974  ORF Transcript_53834/g.64974 Transcript_53834/m.64974 type:complete len:319 (+) Transcript_53834:179-1135(+)|eukprot:CAMPEP_0172501898 /NCGR_PEP_ID=MMETSP1066-20121228/154885_1 /TAXON_ID=671091 /ORGANISM="Coscinodiscus wailesii, Strain CCMP2513" /LENGTH=318 /DNA_ID=CAMNT_0013276945 /DNA_START=154 /DNA_END=1110 /DNA_ORIENTATION=-
MTSKSATALYNSLTNYDAASPELEKINGVIELDSTVKPIDGANTLWKHNILGAPVWNAKTSSYCGVFDIRDILSAVIMTTRYIHCEDKTSQYNTVFEDKVGKYTITYLASRNPIHSGPASIPLKEICETFVKNNCRQLAICKTKGVHCDHMISRSALVRFMSIHTPMEELSEKLSDSGLNYLKSVVSVKDSTTAFETFELMDSKRLYGVAVVDQDDGSLVGYTSAKDVWLAAMDNSKTSMELDVMSYLAAVRQLRIEKDGKTRHPACRVKEDDTISHILHVLVKTRYHRVFVVDKEQKPIGVVSITDIINFTLEKSEK